MVIVSPNGRYHGHLNEEDIPKQVAKLRGGGTTDTKELRVLSDAEWDKIAALDSEARKAGKREELCSSLGKSV